jgi:hypothetical protein
MKQYHKDLGVGIPESTMLAIRGDEAKVHGAAPVIIYDGKNAVYPNDQYTTAYGLTVHAVTHLDSFNLKTRKVVSTKKEVMATKDAAVQSADIFTKSRNEGYNVMRGLIEAKVNKVETTSSQKSPQFTVTFTKLATAKGYSDGKPPTVTDIQLDITHETSTPLNKIVKPAAKQIMKTNATRQLKAKEPILMINNKQIITNTAAIAAGKIYVAISELADYLPITVESIDNGRTIYFIKDGVTKVVARQNYSIIDDYSYNTDRIVYFKNVSYLSVDLITTALGGKLEYSTDNASKRRVAKITY